MTETFCVQPWFSFESRPKGNQVCCWMDLDADVDQVRQDLLDGKRSEACKKCWDAEKQQKPSRRLQQNMMLDSLLNLSIENIEKLVRDEQHSIMLYQIKTSSVCNGACIMCNPLDSSKWAALLKKDQRVLDYLSDDVVGKIDYVNARHIEFLGGEPFLEEKNFLILDNLISANNTDCHLSFITNGNVSMKDALISKLSRFRNVTICLSIDGIGKVFEYHRWPLSWNKLLENLELFRSLNYDISAHMVVTNVNLSHRDETIAWLESQKIPYLISEATGPEWLNPNRPIDEHVLAKLDQQDKLKGINRKDYLGW